MENVDKRDPVKIGTNVDDLSKPVKLLPGIACLSLPLPHGSLYCLFVATVHQELVPDLHVVILTRRSRGPEAAECGMHEEAGV